MILRDDIMHKHAYLIIAHNQFELLETIIKMLDDERNDIYVHIDAKVNDFDFEYFSKLTVYSKIIFTPRIKITWGDFSQVQSEMVLLKTAFQNQDSDNPYSYYHLISGVDLPIKSKDEIYNFFEQNYPAEFIHIAPEAESKGAENRIKYYHLFRKKRNMFHKIIAQIVLKTQKMLGINRLKGKDFVVKKGTNWFSITNEFVKYILSKEDFVNKTFSNSYCCDEVFLQTILFNSPFRDNLFIKEQGSNQFACARLIDWNRGNPYIFTSDDFDEIISSPALFARKFDLQKDKEIICRIKDYVSGKSQNNF